MKASRVFAIGAVLTLAVASSSVVSYTLAKRRGERAERARVCETIASRLESAASRAARYKHAPAELLGLAGAYCLDRATQDRVRVVISSSNATLRIGVHQDAAEYWRQIATAIREQL